MSRFAYSIFCDDIRSELNNKNSLMGMFGGLMYLPSFPAVLPKLGIVLTACTGIDQPFRSLCFRGFMDDDQVFEIAMDDEQLDQANAVQSLIDDPKGSITQAIVMISPFHIQKPGKLRIQVIADGEEIECSGLQISQAPEGMPIA